tara:strand:+ start:91 stop:255 length:165 start_codon:yes stop_codon:yes gene_type:complete
MTDDQMVSKLRSMEQWVTKEPWKSIADRLEELIKIYRLEEHIETDQNQNNLIDK